MVTGYIPKVVKHWQLTAGKSSEGQLFGGLPTQTPNLDKTAAPVTPSPTAWHPHGILSHIANKAAILCPFCFLPAAAAAVSHPDGALSARCSQSGGR